MLLFLGVDGGGTGCRAAVSDASGAILGKGRAGPSNITSDPDGALANILAASTEALPQGAMLTDLNAVLGLAGANVRENVDRLRAKLPFAQVRIENDSVTATKGALRDKDGIVAAIGTGSVFAAQHDQHIRQLGGWGLALGDEGSGAWIGRAMLARCLRATDGLVQKTPLIGEIMAEFGGPDGIVAFGQTANPSDFAMLAPRVTASLDPAAFAVMAKAEADVASAIDHLQSGARLPVVFLGGLGEVFADRLKARWPVHAPVGSALDGALWLARRGF